MDDEFSAIPASPGALIGAENRAAVRTYFIEHPGCTQTECSAALKLSLKAVGRHIKEIRKEWGG